MKREAVLLLLTLLAAGCSTAQPGPATRRAAEDKSAPWTREVQLWPDGSEKLVDWREQAEKRKEIYTRKRPNDLVVAFVRDSRTAPEYMRVRVFAHDPVSGEYLGVLLGQPMDVSSVSAADNVAFRFRDFPSAIDRGQGYRRAAYPRLSPDAFANSLLRGLNRYRVGNFGKDKAAMRDAAIILEKTLALADETTDAQGRYLAHFYLGRAKSELGDSHAAVREYREALRERSGDAEAQLALLAEYSALAKRDAASRQAFIDQETAIRGQLGSEAAALEELRKVYAANGNPPTIAGVAEYRYRRR